MVTVWEAENHCWAKCGGDKGSLDNTCFQECMDDAYTCMELEHVGVDFWECMGDKGW